MRTESVKRWATPIALVAVVLLFAWDTWQRRWVSDDGLIFTRTVRQLLAGNGPVFNAFERVESDTSTLWTYVLALVTWLTGGNVVSIAIGLGGVLSVGGFAIALDATRRLHRGRGATGVLVPAGAFIILGVYPFWDFATSGLETGLAMCWTATAWWLLVTVEPRRRDWLAAFVIGLGPLVRPELALVTIGFGAAAYAVSRPSRKRALALLGVALLLPFAYEIFRAGYYGTLVPMPALAKSATSAEWGRGFAYLRDFATPYVLWLPCACLLGLGVIVVVRRTWIRADAIVIAPIAVALALSLYVLRVGGDFMHARMLLPPLFLLILPALLVPLSRLTAPAVLVLAGWSLVIGTLRNDLLSHSTAEHVEDERVGYSHWVGRNHPTDVAQFVRSEHRAAARHTLAYWTDAREMVLVDNLETHFKMRSDLPGPSVYVDGRLGTGGTVAPLDAIVADTLGLANPLGARITPTNPGFAGHEKPLPAPWLLSQFAAPGQPWVWSNPDEETAARHAMTCGALAEMLASVREPLTPSRFWSNLTGSIARTRLVIPANPIEAEAKFCAISSR